jgi:hypothetical protein
VCMLSSLCILQTIPPESGGQTYASDPKLARKRHFFCLSFFGGQPKKTSFLFAFFLAVAVEKNHSLGIDVLFCRLPTMSEVASFKVLDNGGEPFTVTFEGGDRTFAAVDLDAFKAAFTKFPCHETQLKRVRDGPSKHIRKVVNPTSVIVTETDSGAILYKFNDCKTVFVGYSPPCPTTAFSGGIDPLCVGSSILLHVNDLHYISVGQEVVEFTALAPITEFVSVVGNNDVPYPYAKDSTGNVYLMLDGLAIVPRPDRPAFEPPVSDPYTYFYEIWSAPARELAPWASGRTAIVVACRDPKADYARRYQAPVLGMKREADVSLDEYVQLCEELSRQRGLVLVADWRVTCERL